MRTIFCAVALAILATASGNADVAPHQTRGRVWVDASEAGVMVTVDRARDGVIDDEYFLMTSRDADVSAALMPLAEFDDAEVRVTSRSVWIVSRSTPERYYLYLETKADASADESPVSDEVALESGQTFSGRATITSYGGFGLRHSLMKVTRENQMIDHRFAGPRTDANCDAGGGCSATQCSVDGCEGRPTSCSVSCSSASNTSACCRCTPKAACSCVAC